MKRYTITAAAYMALAYHREAKRMQHTGSNGDGTYTVALDDEVVAALAAIHPDISTAIILTTQKVG